MQDIPEELINVFRKACMLQNCQKASLVLSELTMYSNNQKQSFKRIRTTGLTLKGNMVPSEACDYKVLRKARWFLARPVTAKCSMTFHKYACQSAANSIMSEVSQHLNTKVAQKRYDANIEKMV